MSGHAIKVSTPVRDHISKLRQEGEGYDACLRRQFGLPSRKGKPQDLAEYYAIAGEDLLLFRRKSEATGESILRAVRKGKKFRADHYTKREKVVKVREVPE